MPTLKPQPGGARRADHLSALLAAGIVLNGLRLRQRLAALRTLPRGTASGTGAGEQPGAADELVWLTAAGVRVDDATRAAAEAHLLAEGLDVLDLVPGDLPVEQALDLVRRVDPATYRSARLALGSGAYHAIVTRQSVLQRVDVAVGDELSPVAMLRATEALKVHAAATTDLIVAPGLTALPDDPTSGNEFFDALYGRALPLLSTFPLAHQALLTRGLRKRSPAGLAAFGLHAVQPWLAFSGSALRPRDLLPVSAPGRLGRQSRRTWRALAGFKWTSDETTTREVDAKRPEYEALLAGGLEPFFEPARADCPLCGATDLHELVRVGDLLQGKPGTFRLDECRACRHVFQNPRLSLEGLDFYYRDFYDGLGTRSAELLFASTDTSYRGRARMVRGHTVPRRWLDVGGGHGHFSLIAADEWPDTTFDLLDMSDSVDEAEARRWVSTGYKGLFPDFAPKLAGAYDVVSMHHYLEHTRDPLAELDAAREVLEPGGHLLIEVPNPDSALGRPLGWLWGPWFQPQHQHFLSLGNLTDQLAARGFTVLATDIGTAHQPTELAFGLWLLANRVAPRPPMPWVPRLTPAQRAGRVVTFASFAPLIAVALVLDRLMAPLFRSVPGLSNTYRLLARRDDEP
jgi:SAM-dependent methyltransferase